MRNLRPSLKIIGIYVWEKIDISSLNFVMVRYIIEYVLFHQILQVIVILLTVLIDLQHLRYGLATEFSCISFFANIDVLFSLGTVIINYLVGHGNRLHFRLPCKFIVLSISRLYSFSLIYHKSFDINIVFFFDNFIGLHTLSYHQVISHIILLFVYNKFGQLPLCRVWII